MEYNKSDIVKLFNGDLVKITNLPTSFMSNGSYEVVRWVDNGIGEMGQPFWVKPSDIMYKVDTSLMDDINNYFELIWDEDGLNIIPKGSKGIDIESDREDLNRIKIKFNDGRKYSVVNLHIGDLPITDKEKVTIRPKKEKESKFKKIINVLTKEEDEV